MQGVLWSGFGVALLIMEARRTSPAGLRRLRELDPVRARGVVESYRSKTILWLFGVWSVSNAFNGVVAATEGRIGATVVSALAVVTLVAAWAVHRRNTPIVLREADSLELDPLLQRDSSVKRARRVKQCGAVALVTFLLAPAVMALAEATSSTALWAIGGTALVTAILAVLAMAWAAVWIYGDEEPAT